MESDSLLFVATQTCFLVHEGRNVLVHKGDTVSAGHPILDGRPALFIPFVPTFEFKRGPGRPPKRK